MSDNNYISAQGQFFFLFCFWVKPILSFGRVSLTTNAAMHSCGYPRVTMHLWGTEWINQSIQALAFIRLLYKVSQTCQNSKIWGEKIPQAVIILPPPHSRKNTVQLKRRSHAAEKGVLKFWHQDWIQKAEAYSWAKKWSHAEVTLLAMLSEFTGSRLQKALTPIRSHSFSIMKYSFNNFQQLTTYQQLKFIPLKHDQVVHLKTSSSLFWYYPCVSDWHAWPTDSPVLSDDLRLRVGWIDFDAIIIIISIVVGKKRNKWILLDH